MPKTKSEKKRASSPTVRIDLVSPKKPKREEDDSFSFPEIDMAALEAPVNITTVQCHIQLIENEVSIGESLAAQKWVISPIVHIWMNYLKITKGIENEDQVVDCNWMKEILQSLRFKNSKEKTAADIDSFADTLRRLEMDNRWETCNVNFETSKRLFIPINLANTHYSLIVVCNLCNLKVVNLFWLLELIFLIVDLIVIGKTCGCKATFNR
jgi:hypothetical protein